MSIRLQRGSCSGKILALVLAAGLAHSWLHGSPAEAQSSGREASSPYDRWSQRLDGADTGVFGRLRAESQAEGGIRVTNVRTGSRVTYYPDGSRRTQTPDGRVILVAPDGSSEMRASDGSLVRAKSGNRGASSGSWAAWSGTAGGLPKVQQNAESAQTPAPSDQQERAGVRSPSVSSTAGSVSAPSSIAPTVPMVIVTESAPAQTTSPVAEAPRITIADNGSQRITLSDGSVISVPPTGLSPETSPSVTGERIENAGTLAGNSRIRTVIGNTPPAAPSDLLVVGNIDGGFDLTWTDASSDETAFEIERTPSFSESVVSVAANLTSFTDTQDMPEARYRVRATGQRVNSSWTPWVSVRGASYGFEVLTPGSGFTGETPQPSTIGSSGMAGYDAKAIARWDVVPYQTFARNFHVGVVAFHMNGIDRVEFSANGGPWKAVREMQLNPRSGVWEYTAMLRASDFPDGPVEVRAVAFPKGAGEARVLGGAFDVERTYLGSEWTGQHSLFLFSNASNTQSEEVVELPAGDYIWGQAPLYFGTQSNPERWLTYRPAPGVTQEQVRIVGGTPQVPTQRNFSKIRLQGITIVGVTGNLAWFANGMNKMIWFDKVRVIGPGMYNNNGVNCPTPHQWWTDCFVSDARMGMARQFVRNCRFERIGEDVMRNTYLVINTVVDNVDPGTTGWHSGVIANPLTHDNRIYYGNLFVRLAPGVVAWPFRNGTDTYWENRDIAIIRCETDGPNDGHTHTWFVGAKTENLLVDHSKFDGRAEWRLTGVPTYWVFQPHNVVLRNTQWTGGAAAYPMPRLSPEVVIVNDE